MADILKYYSAEKESVPVYTYYKQKDRGVMDFLFNKNWGGVGAIGDLGTYFGNAHLHISKSESDLLKEISDLDFLVKGVVAREIGKTEAPKLEAKSYIEKVLGISTKKKTKAWNTDRFLQKKSYFERPREEIQKLFEAI